MKIPFRDIEPFVKSPNPAARVILIYGPDDGLMHERAKAIGLTIVHDINDPFNAVNLSTNILLDDPARLSDEACALSMMGGQRLIRIQEASDKLTPLIKGYLENPSAEALIILEAGELGPRSSLRKLCESAKNAAAIPCYIEDERDLSRLIRETLQNESLNAAPDAVSWLAVAIAGDRLKARSELDKLITFKGADKSPVTLEDAQACCGTAGADVLDDLVYAVANHQPEKALKTYAQLMEEDVPFIVVLRSLQNHFRRLHLTKARIEEGSSIESALKSLTPPIFFKQENTFKRQLQQWSLDNLSNALSRLMSLEAVCKKTGTPVETFCAQAILGISAQRKSSR